MNSLPLLRVVVGPVGDTSTRVIIAGVRARFCNTGFRFCFFTPNEAIAAACDAF
jgi:hypothetical protein